MDYESGIGLSDHVKIDVMKGEQKISLAVNPVGQFETGGCLAFIAVKKEDLFSLGSTEELCDYLLRKIYFENLESAFDLDHYTLKNVLQHTESLEVNEENSWWLNYFKRLQKKVNEFKEGLRSFSDLNELAVYIHEYHSASGELCDFVDYTCAPEGEEEDEIRNYFEEKLNDDQQVDRIMDCFEDGYFYGNSFSAKQLTVVDYPKKSFDRSLSIEDIQ
ncbi:MAG: hypothetical protein IIU37_07095 [Erysipelotrichaceae bacterium]|nr:hypothetical protein [Erysipelotrichaceae bacterium]MBQ2138522.1 hypothetical protein [Erysipelotrichaceae bacterium]MBQ2231823.1 hypothetical protein [Erysipelotrichaceae bacterium]MBQ5553336.1 hypothetical protein [Erysipelotrichaceae bacterium]